MKLVEEGKEPTIGIFRDVEENECIPTELHQDRPERGQITRASLSGNIGRDYDVIKELEEIFEREAAAVAAGVR
jgi:hypothetical protein